jgi:hypothetical protein
MNKITPNSLFVNTVIINGIIPYFSYKILSNYTSNTIALSLSVCIPLLQNFYQIYKHKNIDFFGAFILFGTVLGMAAALLGGNEKFILIRESFVTFIIGMCFLMSLLFPKPLKLLLARSFIGNEDRYRRISQKQHRKPFIFVTLIWGIVLASEAMVKVYFVYLVSTSIFLLVSPLFTHGVIGLTSAWTYGYFQKTKKQK